MAVDAGNVLPGVFEVRDTIREYMRVTKIDIGHLPEAKANQTAPRSRSARKNGQI